MYRCQLRIPNSVSLDQWVDLISEKSWLLLLHELHIKKIPKSAYERFHSHLRDVIAPFLRAYSLCGTSEICNEVSGLRAAHLDSRIRHLHLPFSLSNLIDQMAQRIAASLDSRLFVAAPEKLIANLRMILHSVLGEYVSYDHWCGRAPICRYSFPVDPWQDHEHLTRE